MGPGCVRLVAIKADAPYHVPTLRAVFTTQCSGRTTAILALRCCPAVCSGADICVAGVDNGGVVVAPRHSFRILAPCFQKHLAPAPLVDDWSYAKSLAMGACVSHYVRHRFGNVHWVDSSETRECRERTDKLSR